MTTVRRILAVVAFASVGVSATTTHADATAPRPVPGYWLAGSDGGVFSFDAPFYGAGSFHPGAPGPCSFNPQPPSTLNGVSGVRRSRRHQPGADTGF